MLIFYSAIIKKNIFLHVIYGSSEIHFFNIFFLTSYAPNFSIIDKNDIVISTPDRTPSIRVHDPFLGQSADSHVGR